MSHGMPNYGFTRRPTKAGASMESGGAHARCLRRWGLAKRFLSKLGVVALTVTMVGVGAPSSANAYATSDVTFVGHGWGHGRGMGQWGAYGYGTVHGWDYQRILGHFYGGTVSGGASNVGIGVEITEFTGKDAIVTSASGFSVAGRAFLPGHAALIRRTGSNAFTISEAFSCGGPWGWSSSTTGSVGITPAFGEGDQGNDENRMIRVCGSNIRGYRGSFSVIDAGGTQQLINNVSLENYLRGVVPREAPASWGDSEGGLQALRAQSVAARSYALIPRRTYATQCDTISCQVYGGAFLNGARIEDSRTDRAIQDTAGVVRRWPNGTMVSTEFSSSTGGWTAGGAFPAVADEGDSVAGNSRHQWTASVPVSRVESAYGVGTLLAIEVVQRNGLGSLGGRVQSVRIVGTAQTVTTTGADVRAKLGLNSDWFAVQGQPSGGTAGYWVLGEDGGVFSFGNAPFFGSMGGKPLNQPVVGMAPTPNYGGYWQVARDGGIFAFGNAPFFGSMGGRPLNAPMVAMAPRAQGGYWTVASDGGVFSFGNAPFFGSMGGKPLNRPIVGMAPTASGNGYWLVASDGGIFAFGDAQFRGSTGGIRLNQPVVAMAGTADGNGYWMVARDGGIFNYGSARFAGSAGGTRLSSEVVGMSATRNEGGYNVLVRDGTVLSFGDAPYFGGVRSAVPGFVGRVQAIVNVPG